MEAMTHCRGSGSEKNDRGERNACLKGGNLVELFESKQKYT